VRYYKIVITDPNTTVNDQPKIVRSWSSLDATGAFIPGALQIEMDLPVYAMAAPAGTAYLKIWGISLQDIAQAQDYKGLMIQIYAGMSKGLPLANPDQSGLVTQGMVQQSFGNWQGVNMTLDFVIQPEVGYQDAPANIVLNWKAGTTLASALGVTLPAAFPGYTAPVININPKLVLPHDEVAYFQTATQLARYVKGISQSIIGGLYTGVDMLIKNNQFIVFDGTSQSNPRQVLFRELIGQPTWIEFGVIQFKCAMRADLNVNDFIAMPPATIAITTAQAYSQYKNQSVFQNNFRIIQARHIGNFRQRDASAWVTVFDAAQTTV